jgi:hypothetical protein
VLQKTTNLAVFVSIVALAPGAVQPIGAEVAGATLSGTITDQQGGTLGGAGYVWPVSYTPGSNGAGNNALVNPLVGNIQSTMWQSRLWYNALEMKFSKRFSRGFQAQVTYTFSKSIDDSSGSAASDKLDYVTEPWYDFRLNQGVSDLNMGPNLVMTGMWTPSTPKTKGARTWALGGWQFGVITEISDGIAFYRSDGSDMLGEINPSVHPQRFNMAPGSSSYGSAIPRGKPEPIRESELLWVGAAYLRQRSLLRHRALPSRHVLQSSRQRGTQHAHRPRPAEYGCLDIQEQLHSKNHRDLQCFEPHQLWPAQCS